MKLLTLLIFLIAPCAFALPTVVQAASCPALVRSGTQTCSFSTLPSVGNTVALGTWQGGGSCPNQPSTSAFTDNQASGGNSYALLQAGGIGVEGPVELWAGVVTKSTGTFTVTYTCGSGGTGWQSIGMVEYNNMPGAVTVTATINSNPGSSGGISTCTTFTSVASNSVVLVVGGDSTGSGTPTAGSGFAREAFSIPNGAAGFGIMEDQILSATGNVTPTYGNPSPGTGICIGVTMGGLVSGGPLLNGTTYMHGKGILQ